MANDEELPNLPRLQGFLAKDGSNPFAERGAQSQQEPDNPYSSQSPDDSQPVYQPGDYESRIAHRGGLVLGLGVASFLFMLAIPFSCGLTCPMALVLGAAAWACGRTDTRAMADGVMDQTGRGFTRIGQSLGAAAVFLSLVMVIVVLCYWLQGVF